MSVGFRTKSKSSGILGRFEATLSQKSTLTLHKIDGALGKIGVAFDNPLVRWNMK